MTMNKIIKKQITIQQSTNPGQREIDTPSKDSLQILVHNVIDDNAD